MPAAVVSVAVAADVSIAVGSTASSPLVLVDPRLCGLRGRPVLRGRTDRHRLGLPPLGWRQSSGQGGRTHVHALAVGAAARWRCSVRAQPALLGPVPRDLPVPCRSDPCCAEHSCVDPCCARGPGLLWCAACVPCRELCSVRVLGSRVQAGSRDLHCDVKNKMR